MVTISPFETPKKITGAIKRECAQITGQELQFLQSRPRLTAKRNRCAFNVRELVEKEGGEIILGWKIEIWSPVLLHLVGHAVWLKDGDLTCVTPQPEAQILFVPDETITFDFKPTSRLPTQMLPLIRDSAVMRLIKNIEQDDAIRHRYPVSSGPLVLQGQDAADAQRLQLEKTDLIMEIALKYQDLNGRCVCTSGKKFKKCCRIQMLRAK
jgi:hypothetical protein